MSTAALPGACLQVRLGRWSNAEITAAERARALRKIRRRRAAAALDA